MTLHPALQLARAALLAAFLAPAGAGLAQDYPTKPVTLVVTYPPGGGADLMARLVAPKLAEALGQPVVVENKPGAAGQVGAAFVANARPDGHVAMIDAASFVINQSLYPSLPYDAGKAFRAVGVLAAFPHVIVVTPGFEAKTAPELVAMAKAKPGAISYASSGTGSAQHLAGATFLRQTGAQMTHVPYKGGGPAMNDVMGGHIPVFFANIASGLAHIRSGKLRALAVASDRRVAALPDVPTTAEVGVGGPVVYEWNGLFVPAGTPDAVLARLAAALDKAMQDPQVRQRIADLGGETIGGGVDGATRFIAGQRELTGALIREGNIRPD